MLEQCDLENQKEVSSDSEHEEVDDPVARETVGPDERAVPPQWFRSKDQVGGRSPGVAD